MHRFQAQFVDELNRAELHAEVGKVCESRYWAVMGHMVVGRISLRHALNENLKEFGGHIGYEVRPSQRGQGLASQMLHLLLNSERAKKIGRLLLTCAPNNLASIRVIEKNGGVLEKTAFVERENRQTNYYWIQV